MPETPSIITAAQAQIMHQPKLLDGLREALRARHYCQRTEEIG